LPRLAKDLGKTIASARTFLYAASVMLLARPLLAHLEALPNTLGFLIEMRFQALLHLRHMCGKSSSSPGETLFRYLLCYHRVSIVTST